MLSRIRSPVGEESRFLKPRADDPSIYDFPESDQEAPVKTKTTTRRQLSFEEDCRCPSAERLTCLRLTSDQMLQF